MAESQISNEKSTNCLNCTFKAVNKEELFKHVRVHQYDHNFRIACPHCPQILKHLTSYRIHVKCCLKKLAFTTNDYDEEKTVGNTVKIWKCTTLIVMKR